MQIYVHVDSYFLQSRQYTSGLIHKRHSTKPAAALVPVSHHIHNRLPDDSYHVLDDARMNRLKNVISQSPYLKQVKFILAFGHFLEKIRFIISLVF